MQSFNLYLFFCDSELKKLRFVNIANMSSFTYTIELYTNEHMFELQKQDGSFENA